MDGKQQRGTKDRDAQFKSQLPFYFICLTKKKKELPFYFYFFEINFVLLFTKKLNFELFIFIYF